MPYDCSHVSADVAIIDRQIAERPYPDDVDGQALQLRAATRLRWCHDDRRAATRLERMLSARRDLDVSALAAFSLMSVVTDPAEWIAWVTWLAVDPVFGEAHPEEASVLRDTLRRLASGFPVRHAP